MLQSHQRTATSAIGAFATPVRRRELFVWVVAILALNVFLSVEPQSGTHYAAALAQSLASKSAFQFLGWFAVVRLLLDGDTLRRPDRRDTAFALGAGLLPFLPWHALLWISATAVGVYLALTSRDDRKVQAAAVVLLALSVNGMWAPHLFELFAYPLLWADTALVGTALNLTRSGFTWHATIIATGEHSIAVLGPCSSFHNISLGLLCWVSLTKLARPRWVSSDVLTALLVVAAVLLFNTARIYLMALSPASYLYWHSGSGAYLHTLALSATVVAISLWGAYRGSRRA